MDITLAQARANRQQPNVHEGEGAQVGEEQYVRMVGDLKCLIIRAVDIEDITPYLKLIACLIFTESFYASSMSYKVIQTLSTGLYNRLKNPKHSTPVNSGGSSKAYVEYKFYTRTPCLSPADLSKVGGSAARNFSVIGSSNRCGFIEYNFDLAIRYLRSSEIDKVENQYYVSVEENLSNLKCNEIMSKIADVRKQFSQFRLADYLGILNFKHKGRQLGKSQAFPPGWLDASHSGPIESSSEAASSSQNSSPFKKLKKNLSNKIKKRK